MADVAISDQSHSAAVDPDTAEQAAQLLAVLREFTEAPAAAIMARDPLDPDGPQLVLSSHGYSREILEHAAGGFGADTGLHREAASLRKAVRWRDYRRDWHVDIDNTETAALLSSVGFREGASAPVIAPVGRQLGSVHVSWCRTNAATDRRRSAIDRLLPLAAGVCDLVKEPNRLCHLLDPASNARVHTPAGWIDTDSRPVGPHLRDNAALWKLIGRVPRAGRYIWFDERRLCHRVDIIACGRSQHLVAEHEIPRPHHLTVREFETLHLISLGVSNADIGKVLVLSPKTVGTYVEHALKKLRCVTRAELAANAVREGLLLIDPPHGPLV